MSTDRESRTLAAVAVGGVLGASARWAVGAIVDNPAQNAFPWPTLVVNVLGCLLIGVATRRIVRDTLWWHFATTGLLGGFTTMSGLAVETEGLLDAGRVGAASSYVAASLLVGFAALLLGERIGSGATRRTSAISMERER